MTLRVGECVGDYRIVAHIGSGGMGDVFLVVRRAVAGFRRLLVAKVLKAELADQEGFVEAFLHEGRLAARLHHPNVIQTIETAEVDGLHVLVMEYVDGRSVSELRRRAHQAGREIAVELWLEVVCQALDGLHHAHEARDLQGTPLHIVHRDATPGNLLVSVDGELKVVDFGIAKAADTDARTATGVIKGTIRYMAPERVMGASGDRRVDVYSMGVVLWELLAGRSMFPSVPAPTVLHQISTGNIPRLDEIAPHTSAGLVEIVHRAIAFDPSLRFETASAMRLALSPYLRQGGSRAALGEHVRALFAAERAERLSQIAAQLRTLDAGATTARSDAVSDPALGASAALERTRAPAGRRGRVLAGIAVLAALGGGAAAWWAPTPDGPTPPPSESASAARSVTLEVSIVPSAQLEFDGMQSSGTNVRFETLASSQPRRLVARATGYRDRVLEVLVEHDRSISLTLAPEVMSPVSERAPTEPSDAPTAGETPLITPVERRGTGAPMPDSVRARRSSSPVIASDTASDSRADERAAEDPDEPVVTTGTADSRGRAAGDESALEGWDGDRAPEGARRRPQIDLDNPY